MADRANNNLSNGMVDEGRRNFSQHDASGKNRMTAWLPFCSSADFFGTVS
jgi:hypothetical protein